MEHLPLDKKHYSVKNPILIIKVLSPTTEGYDRGLKFKMYRSLPTLREYVLISQDEPLVETFYRQDDKSWHYQVSQGMDAEVMFSSIEHPVALKSIYQKVDFSSGEAVASPVS